LFVAYNIIVFIHSPLHFKLTGTVVLIQHKPPGTVSDEPTCSSTETYDADSSSLPL